MAQIEIHQVSVPLGGAAGTADTLLVRAPSAATGGGISVQAAYVVNGAPTTAGTCFAVTLERRSAAGTPAANGTVGAVGGTADLFAAKAPKQFSLDSDYVYLSPGESLWAKVTQSAGSGTPTDATVQVLYQMGR